jgi:peptidyl-prolyl cis-trans isomerase D
MIRILQQNNKVIKVIFAVIIGLAVVTMVITLVPGIFDNVGASGDPANYATVRPTGVFGRVFGETIPITQTEVARLAQQQAQRQGLPAMYAQFLMAGAGQAMVQRAILQIEADRMHLQVTDADLVRELHQGQLGQILFPGGTYIGDEKYMDFVQNQLGMTRGQFESLVKKEMEEGRLQALVTGGVTVSDNEVRDSYRVAGTKIKFDYAVVSAADIAKSLNPSDADLQAFFKSNAARYANAVPETRKIEYVSFGADDLPGGPPKVSDADVQAYYNAHLADYQVKEQVRARHILISVPEGADAKTDAAAKAKADDLEKQLHNGADFAALAKANSDDPGSKAQGGELGFFTRGKMVPAFEQAAFALQPGQISPVVKTSFGYHIIQVEEKQTAHTKPLDEVKAQILPILQQQRLGAAEQAFANTLTSEAKKNGIDKTAQAHNLHAITTDYLARDGVVAGVSDGTAMLSGAFTAAKGAPPASASTGDGFAVYQVVDVKAAHAPTFEEWKSHILADYREEKIPALLSEQLNKLAARAKALGDLHKAAAEMNVPVKSSDLVGKDGQVPEVGSMAGAASVAFSLPKGGISGPIMGTQTGEAQTGVVLSVTDKQEPSAEDVAKNFEATKAQMLDERREEVFRVYLGTLSDKYQKAGAIRMKAKQPALPLS